MTCIVGLAHGGRVWIGADAALTDDGTTQPGPPKLWRAGGYLVGAAGNGAWFAVLRRLRWPAEAGAGYVPTTFLSDLVTAGAELGVTFPAAEDSPADGAAVVGGAGLLWYVDSALDAIALPATAIGTGGWGARAVLAACPGGGPRRRILRALEAVGSVRTDVGGPYTVESI